MRQLDGTVTDKPSPVVFGYMSTPAEESPAEDGGSIFEDDWIRDVTKMGIGWLVGTIIGIILLVFVGPMVF